MVSFIRSGCEEEYHIDLEEGYDRMDCPFPNVLGYKSCMYIEKIGLVVTYSIFIYIKLLQLNLRVKII